jgi:exosome complex component RRP42
MNTDAKENISKLLSEGYRQDQRKLNQFRDIEIELGVVEMAEGSARVKCGNTEVIAGVKLKLGAPFPDTPDEGVLMVNTELTPLSNPEFEFGPPRIDAIETSRVIDRGLREGQAMDVKKLCVEKGEKVWMVSVDVCPINFDGNLIDIGGLAALAAIHNAKLPEIDEDGNVDYKNKSKKGLPLVEEPLPITIIKIKDNFIVDPTQNEMELLDARVTLTFRKDGNLCAVQKGGDGPITTEDLDKMIKLAKESVDKNRKLLEKAIK